MKSNKLWEKLIAYFPFSRSVGRSDLSGKLLLVLASKVNLGFGFRGDP
jgi:hypothetical protein